MMGAVVAGELEVQGSLPERALRYLGLAPEDPTTWVLAALAHRYQLDPLLNEVAVIRTKQGLKPYVTRDGMLTVAHRSGQFDGMTTDEMREGDHGWAATVTVWRKDMAHGFTYSAGCGRREPQAVQGNGAEMALARAERRALRRAFNIPAAGGEWDDDDPEVPAGGAPATEDATTRSPSLAMPDDVPYMTHAQGDEIGALLGVLGLTERNEVRAYITAVVGREIEDVRTITYAEADAILDRLTADVDEMSAPDEEAAQRDDVETPPAVAGDGYCQDVPERDE
jgi:hypothetical protein